MRGTGLTAAALALALCQGAAAQQQLPDPGDNTFGNLFRRGPIVYPQVLNEWPFARAECARMLRGVHSQERCSKGIKEVNKA